MAFPLLQQPGTQGSEGRGSRVGGGKILEPVIDETIQIFSNRGSQVQDVLLDFAGVCAGMAVTLIIRWLTISIRGMST